MIGLAGVLSPWAIQASGTLLPILSNDQAILNRDRCIHLHAGMLRPNILPWRQPAQIKPAGIWDAIPTWEGCKEQVWAKRPLGDSSRFFP